MQEQKVALHNPSPFSILRLYCHYQHSTSGTSGLLQFHASVYLVFLKIILLVGNGEFGMGFLSGGFRKNIDVSS
jgi:hypothetical protein